MADENTEAVLLAGKLNVASDNIDELIQSLGCDSIHTQAAYEDSMKRNSIIDIKRYTTYLALRDQRLLDKLSHIKYILAPRVISNDHEYCDSLDRGFISDVKPGERELFFKASLLPKDHRQPKRPYVVLTPFYQYLLGRKIPYAPAKSEDMACSHFCAFAGHYAIQEKLKKLTQELDSQDSNLPKHDFSELEKEFKKDCIHKLKSFLEILLDKCRDWVKCFASDRTLDNRRRVEYLNMCHLLLFAGHDVKLDWVAGPMKGRMLVGKVASLICDEWVKHACVQGTTTSGENFREEIMLASFGNKLHFTIIEPGKGQLVSSRRYSAPTDEWLGDGFDSSLCSDSSVDN